MVIQRKLTREIEKLPIGVVSKNDVGDRKTALSAALKRFRLATKLAMLWNADDVNKVLTVE